MYQNNILSHADAAAIVEMIRKRAEQLDTEDGASIAVVDAHGELLAFLRMDGCRFPSINIAINKAFTAARECTESINVGDRAREFNFPVTNYGDLRYLGWGGGVPVVFGGKVVGAVGVSGLPEEMDIELAKAGAEMLK